jgi:hypothetical protein
MRPPSSITSSANSVINQSGGSRGSERKAKQSQNKDRQNVETRKNRESY